VNDALISPTTIRVNDGINGLPGAGLIWKLHPACAAWPEMSPSELRDLANDIAANGQHDPITLTTNNLLLDGRNRALACVMLGIDPALVVYEGDPWLFSLSRNKHRRHMAEAEVALVAASLATKPLGANQHEGGYKKLPSIKEAAIAVGVPETAIKAAKVVLNSGTPEEIASVRSCSTFCARMFTSNRFSTTCHSRLRAIHARSLARSSATCI
jgi:hypothetical protein